MTPDELARIHGEAFAPHRGWTAEEFEQLVAQKTVDLFTYAHGFALVRTIADEAELLTLAVAPYARRKGIANNLMVQWLSSTRAQMLFLEVADDNEAARALYLNHGFEITGSRKGYYQRQNGGRADALLMQLALPVTDSSESGRTSAKSG